MYVRDVIEATGAAGEVSTEVLLSSEKTRAVVKLRNVGFLVSSRATGKSLEIIARAWKRPNGKAIAQGALKAASELAAGDAKTAELLRLTLGFLGLKTLPPAAPVYKISTEVLDRRIQLAEAHLAQLREQRASVEARVR